jgi:L,D-transpeptidase ErfK/SrfK
MRLGVPGYLIHGTNKPYGIGMRVTHGCVRMYPEDIERLFGMVPVGTPVRLVDQPVKVGRLNGDAAAGIARTAGRRQHAD